MGYPITKNFMEQGGDRWIIGGTIDREGAPKLDNLSVMLPQHYQITPAAASATAVHAAVTLADGETTEVTTEITGPDVPRTVTVKGNQADMAGNVVVTGINFLDQEITDTIALNGTTEVEGVKAFKDVTSYLLPERTTEGDTVSIGVGKKFGLPHIVKNAALMIVKLFNGAADSGSLSVDDDEIEKNLFALDGTPDGAKVLDLFYLV